MGLIFSREEDLLFCISRLPDSLAGVAWSRVGKGQGGEHSQPAVTAVSCEHWRCEEPSGSESSVENY